MQAALAADCKGSEGPVVGGAFQSSIFPFLHIRNVFSTVIEYLFQWLLYIPACGTTMERTPQWHLITVMEVVAHLPL